MCYNIYNMTEYSTKFSFKLFRSLIFVMTLVLFSFSVVSSSYLGVVKLNSSKTQNQSPLTEAQDEELKESPILKQITSLLIELPQSHESINHYHYIEQMINSGYIQQVDRPPKIS